MTLKELSSIRKNYILKNFPYRMCEWSTFNYGILGNILYRRRSGRGQNTTYNEAIIMADTETSKKPDDSGHNHVVA